MAAASRTCSRRRHRRRPKGIILPPVRRVIDTSGRIFLFFVDDLHLQFQNSGRVRELFKKIAKNLVHEGDLFGIVSSGPSSIAIDMTYDRKRLDEAINKIAGSGLKPSEIINRGSGSGGPTELRYNAHVAFSTMREALKNLEKVHNRRKAIVWVSEGYDFNPFQESRLGTARAEFAVPAEPVGGHAEQRAGDTAGASGDDPVDRAAEAVRDLQRRRSGVRARRRLRGRPTARTPRSTRSILAGSWQGRTSTSRWIRQEWGAFVRKSQDSMRVLAEETGGLAVVNMNNFDKALKQIDGASSDYYVLGYYSSNPDPTKRRRQIEVKVARRNANVFTRKEYVLKPPPRPTVPPPAASKP